MLICSVCVCVCVYTYMHLHSVGSATVVLQNSIDIIASYMY